MYLTIGLGTTAWSCISFEKKIENWRVWDGSIQGNLIQQFGFLTIFIVLFSEMVYTWIDWSHILCNETNNRNSYSWTKNILCFLFVWVKNQRIFLPCVSHSLNRFCLSSRLVRDFFPQWNPCNHERKILDQEKFHQNKICIRIAQSEMVTDC